MHSAHQSGTETQRMGGEARASRHGAAWQHARTRQYIIPEGSHQRGRDPTCKASCRGFRPP